MKGTNNEVERIISQIKESPLRVYQNLGSGWLEKVHQEAIRVEFRLAWIQYGSAVRSRKPTFR